MLQAQDYEQALAVATRLERDGDHGAREAAIVRELVRDAQRISQLQRTLAQLVEYARRQVAIAEDRAIEAEARPWRYVQGTAQTALEL